MKQLILSRRNLETLLSKLDRVKGGDFSACSLIKLLPSGESIVVTAVEDSVAYADRPATEVMPEDTPPIRHLAGTIPVVSHQVLDS